MTFPKIIFIAALGLFTIIGAAALFKSGGSKQVILPPVEVQLPAPKIVTTPVAMVTATTSQPPKAKPQPVALPAPAPAPAPAMPTPVPAVPVAVSPPKPTFQAAVEKDDQDHVNLIPYLFNKGEPKLPIVETITYKSRVNWKKGKSAWVADYASHYETSRHFIARSLNGTTDYFKQNVAEGDRFNVFKLEKNIEFYLVLDATRCKLRLYYFDKDLDERVLLRTYTVGLGRKDASRMSGLLTPLGKYSLGNKIATYQPKMMGNHKGQRIEMIQVFGTRWIPFDKEITGCTAPAKGFGIHGVPWTPNERGTPVEDVESLGKYESDGCVRLASGDMEEIFAIIITKPATIEIVTDFKLASLPGVEKKLVLEK